MKVSKQVEKMRRNKKQQRTKQVQMGMPDDLAIENAIRRRHNADWPKIIREMMTRVQNVNQAWGQIMQAVMMFEGLRVTYAREGENLVITVSYKDSVEQHTLTPEEVAQAATYIEVLVMNKLQNSQLIMKAFTGK